MSGELLLFTVVFVGLAILVARRGVPAASALILFAAGVLFAESGFAGVIWGLIDFIYQGITNK